MCYICERQGHVGPNYKAALREIGRALKVWGKKKPGCDGERVPLAPKPEGGDWIKEPTRAEPWTAKDFDKWQAAHRYTLLPGA